MKLITLLLAASRLATAVFIDHSLPNGIYSAYPDPSNPSNHILKRDDGHLDLQRRQFNFWTDVMSGDTSPANRTLREKLPLPDPGHFCWPGHDFNASDFHPAINDLFIEPLYWVPPRFAKFALHGSMVAFICTNSGWNSASLVEFVAAMDILNDGCGATVGGKVSIPDWGKMYGRDSRGEDICDWEYELGGIRNELLDVQEKGCDNYISAVARWFGREDRGWCNANAGWSMWEETRKRFPWYHRPYEADEKGNGEQKNETASEDGMQKDKAEEREIAN